MRYSFIYVNGNWVATLGILLINFLYFICLAMSVAAHSGPESCKMLNNLKDALDRRTLESSQFIGHFPSPDYLMAWMVGEKSLAGFSDPFWGPWGPFLFSPLECMISDQFSVLAYSQPVFGWKSLKPLPGGLQVQINLPIEEKKYSVI